MPGTSPSVLPALALTLNAAVWGTAWWPLRQLEQRGLHPLWSTVIVYGLAVAVIAAWRPGAFAQVARRPALWVLVLASGTTNAAFNWGVTIGDVVRVVLLFYLMPLWAALLSRLLLCERLTRLAALRVALALVGAAVVLRPAGGGGWAALPLPQSLPEALGLLGGFSFALNNVMLRREAAQPEAARAMAMFTGGAAVSGVLASLLSANGLAPWPPAVQPGWLVIAGVLGVLFLASNAALQYGASRLPGNATSVIMLSEVVFAAATAAGWGGAQIDAARWIGGGLIVGAALLAAFEPRPAAR